MRWQDVQDLLEGRRNRPDPGITAAVLIVGVTAGLAVGLLLAPRSGKETRAILQQKARSGLGSGKDALDGAKDKVSQVADTTKQVAQDTKRDVATGSGTDQSGGRRR